MISPAFEVIVAERKQKALFSCFGCKIVNMAGGLAYSNIELSIRRVIFKEIEKRNYREKEPFEVLISTCTSSLFTYLH